MQAGLNRVKIFVQHHEKFLPLDERLWDQNDPDQVVEMNAVIDKKYEELYEKHKHRGFGKYST